MPSTLAWQLSELVYVPTPTSHPKVRKTEIKTDSWLVCLPLWVEGLCQLRDSEETGSELSSQMDRGKLVMLPESDVSSELPLTWDWEGERLLKCNYLWPEIEKERDCSNALIKMHSFIQIWTFLQIVNAWGLINCLRVYFALKNIFSC